MRRSLLLAALLATLPAAACHSSSGGGHGATGGSTTQSSGNGAGGSCVGTTPQDVCNEKMPCKAGYICVQDMDLTTCAIYGASCDPFPTVCLGMPTCDCMMKDPDLGIVDCSGDANQGFFVDHGFGDSPCCP